MTDYSDRRKEYRKVVMAFTPVYNLNTGKLLGYLRNLTLKGAQVNGELKLEVDTNITLSIEVPENIQSLNGKRLNIDAHVARCEETPENPNSYEIGFEFINIKPGQSEQIEKILERFHFRHKLY